MLLRHERATPGRWLAIVISFASVLVLLGVERFRLEDQLVVGDLLTLANGCFFSLFLVMSRDLLKRLDPLSATAWLFFFGTLGILVIGGGPLLHVPFGSLPPRFWWLAAYAVRSRRCWRTSSTTMRAPHRCSRWRCSLHPTAHRDGVVDGFSTRRPGPRF